MTGPRLLLKKWDLSAKKQFGQNFLSEPATARRIVEQAGITPNDAILEIGAGLGALTIPIALTGAQVIALEKDYELVRILEEEIAGHGLNNVAVLNGDILRFNLQDLSEKAGRKLVVMGNLPYNISSQVVVRLIQNRGWVERAVLMFQKELAQRIAATHGGKEYGRISAMLQYCAAIRTLARVEAHQFFPKPKVDSSILEIRFKEVIPEPADDEALLFRLIKAAFGKRRKTLKNALTGSELGITAAQALDLLDRTGIAPERRAETLAVSEFVALSNALTRMWAQ